MSQICAEAVYEWNEQKKKFIFIDRDRVSEITA